MISHADLRAQIQGLARYTSLSVSEISRLIIQVLAAQSLLERAEVEHATLGGLRELFHAADHRSRYHQIEPFGRSQRVEALPSYLVDQVLHFATELNRDLVDVRQRLDLCVDLIRLGDTRRDGVVYDSDLTALLTEALTPQNDETAYCAFPGAAETAFRLALQGVNVRLDLDGRELAETWAAVAIATDLPVEVSRDRPFEEFAQNWPANIETFDLAVVMPPFGLKIGHIYQVGMGLGGPTSEAWGLMMASVRGRRGLAVVPNSIIFRTTASEQSFKEKLIQRFGLRAVIALRAGTLLPLTNIASSLVVFGREEASENRVLVINPDAEGRDKAPDVATIATLLATPSDSPWGRLVSTEELRAHDYNLSPDRYVLTEKVRAAYAVRARGIALEKVAEIIRPQNIVLSPSADEWERPLLELGVADIGDFGLVTSISKPPGTPEDRHKAERAMVRRGDILLVVKGSVGKVGFFDGLDTALEVIASQSFVILRCHPDGSIIDPAVLFRFLSSDIGRAVLDSLKTGSAVPTLQVADVRTFPILVPPRSEQGPIAQETRDLFDLQRDLEKRRSAGLSRRAEMWPDREGDV